MKLKYSGTLAVCAVIASFLFLYVDRQAERLSRVPEYREESASNVRPPAQSIFVLDPLSAPTWAVPFGKEFWKQGRGKPITTKEQILASGLIERMKLRFRQDGASGLPTVYSREYTLAMDAAGFRFNAEAGSFHIATQMVDIPGVPSRGEIGSWNVIGNTAQRDRFGDQSVIEHVEAEAEGASITWIIPKAPATMRDSRIHVAVTGGTVAKGGTIQMGPTPVATWGGAVAVDATGKRTPLTSRFDDGQVKIEIPAALLAGSSYPLAIDPTVSAITDLDPAETIRPTSINPVKIIGNGTSWLLLTEDGDLVLVDTAGEAVVPQILSSTDFLIEDIALTSGKYIAVGNSDATPTNLDAMLFEVSAGVVTNLTTSTLFTPPANRFPSRITAETSADRTLITWTIRNDVTGDQTEGVLGMVLDADGIPVAIPFGITGFDSNLDSQFVSSSAGSGAQSWVALVKSTDGGATTYDAHYITAAGSITQTTIPSTTVAELAWGGTAGWLVTWPSGANTLGQRFSATDGAANGTSFTVYTGTNSRGLVGSTNGWAQMFRASNNDLLVTTVASNAATANVATGVNGSYRAGVAHANETAASALFVLERTVSGNDVNYSFLVDPATGTLTSGPTVLIEKPNDQSRLSVVGNGTTILAAWIDDANPMYTSVVGVRLDNTGSVLDGTPLNFSESETGDFQDAVSTAVVGNTFLVSFTESDNLGQESALGRLCSEAGVLSGTEPFEIGAAEFGLETPLIAAEGNGSSFFVAWVEYNEDDEQEIRGVQASTTGAVGSETILAPASFLRFYPEVTLASDGTEWVVAYTIDDFSVSGVDSRFVARRIVSPGTLAGSEIIISSDFAELVDLGFSGGQYLAVWNEENSSELIGRRFTSGGTLFSPVILDDFAFRGTVIGQTNGWLVGLSGFDDDLYVPRVIRVNPNGAPDRVPQTVTLAEGDAIVARNASNGAFVGIQKFDLVGTRVLGATVEYTEPLVTSAAEAVGQVGVGFTYTITSDIATTYNVAGTLPPGLNLNNTTGVVSGTPTVAGTYPLTILASLGSDTGEMSFSIQILPETSVEPDRTAPVVSVKKRVVTNKSSAKVKITTNDGVSIRYRIKPPGGKFSKFRIKAIAGSTNLTVRTPEEGVYVVEFYAYDSSGNISGKQTIRVTRKE